MNQENPSKGFIHHISREKSDLLPHSILSSLRGTQNEKKDFQRYTVQSSESVPTLSSEEVTLLTSLNFCQHRGNTNNNFIAYSFPMLNMF